MQKTIRIGTRKSKLALVQTHMVEKMILEAFPDLNNRAVKMRLYERALPIPNDIRSRGSQRRTWGGIRVDRLLEDR